MSMINHPAHYQREGRKECIEEMIDMFGLEPVINFCMCNQYKYQYRAGMKDGNSMEQDLKKAEWYSKKTDELIERWNLSMRRTQAKLNGYGTEDV